MWHFSKPNHEGVWWLGGGRLWCHSGHRDEEKLPLLLTGKEPWSCSHLVTLMMELSHTWQIIPWSNIIIQNLKVSSATLLHH